MTTPIPVAEAPTVADIISGLSMQDRCDRCNAQAFVRASILLSDNGIMVDLFFCAHHFAQHEVPLRERALAVQDERGRINKKPASLA